MIVNISSSGGDFSIPLISVYAASKVSFPIADSIQAGCTAKRKDICEEGSWKCFFFQ